MNSSKKTLPLIGLGVLVLFGLYVLIARPVWSRYLFSPNARVAQVGTSSVIGRDVLQRMKAMRAFGPTSDEKVATDQLIQGLTFYEILKGKAGTDLDAAIDQEVEAMDASSNPAWKQAKKSFGSNSEAMKKVLLVPMSMDKLIYTEGYLKDAEYHKKERAEAENTLAQVKRDPGRMKELATQRKHFFFEGILDDAKGLSWKNPEKAMAQQLKDGLLIAQTWNRSFFKELKEGQVASQLIDEGSQWLVVRKGPFQKPGAYKIEVVAIAKKPFLKWLEENRAKIPTKRYGLTSGG